MALIEARQLTKRFRMPVKSPGLAGAVKHLVQPHHEEKLAVDSIDLQIEAGESGDRALTQCITSRSGTSLPFLCEKWYTSGACGAVRAIQRRQMIMRE